MTEKQGYKTCLLVHRSLYGLNPSYINDLVRLRSSDDTVRYTQSGCSASLLVPLSNEKFCGVFGHNALDHGIDCLLT